MPIVFAMSADPVSAGLAANLSRPEGLSRSSLTVELTPSGWSLSIEPDKDAGRCGQGRGQA